MKEKSKSYFVASIYYLIGNVIGQGFVLLSSIIFTRMMSQSDYGLVNTYNAWVLILNTFIGLNLFVTVRNAYIDYFKEYKKFCSSVLVFSLISSVVLSSIIIIGIKGLRINVALVVVVIAILQAVSVHAINYISAIYSMENKYKARTFFMVFPNIIHTIVSVVFICIFYKKQFYGKILGNSVGMAIFGLLAIVLVFKREKPTFSKTKEYWKYAALISVPGIAYSLSDLLLMQSDRIMLTDLVGAGETAVYSVVYNIGSILIALYTAINGSWTPWFYKKLSMNEIDEMKKMQKYYILSFALISICLMFIAPEVIKILSPREYWSGIKYVNLIILASFLIFLYSFFTTYLMYLKRVMTIATNTISAAIVNIIVNRILIPEHKAVGAAYATIFSYVLLFILHFWAIKKDERQVFSMGSFAFGIIVVIGGCGLYQILYPFFVIRLVVLLIMGSIVGVWIWKNKTFLERRK